MKCPRSLFAILLIGSTALGGTVNPPIAAEVYVKTDGRAAPQRGALTSFDDNGFTLRAAGIDKQYTWTDITPASAFPLRQRTIDRTKASDWLALGKWGWGIGATAPAQNALRMSVKLDPSLKSQVDEVLASASGSALAKVPDKELITAASSQPSRAKNENPNDPPLIFSAPSEQQVATAMRKVHEQRDRVEKGLQIKLSEFETEHFIVFSNWDAGDFDFLKTNLEQAYQVVAGQFQMSPKDTVFVGKLPVYMLDKFDDFSRFAKQIDGVHEITKLTAGYFMGEMAGSGHMAMWKPNSTLTGTNNLDDARRLWAYTLVHEFTHAFLARYKSNKFIPRWLNEGIAEVIAMNKFPYPQRYRIARYMASANDDLMFLFEDGASPTGEYYPVMLSMVELLVQTNRQSFLKLIDEIKAGKDPEKAMQEIYHSDYATFEREWRAWAKNQYGGM